MCLQKSNLCTALPFLALCRLLVCCPLLRLASAPCLLDDRFVARPRSLSAAPFGAPAFLTAAGVRPQQHTHLFKALTPLSIVLRSSSVHMLTIHLSTLFCYPASHDFLQRPLSQLRSPLPKFNVTKRCALDSSCHRFLQGTSYQYGYGAQSYY